MDSNEPEFKKTQLIIKNFKKLNQTGQIKIITLPTNMVPLVKLKGLFTFYVNQT